MTERISTPRRRGRHKCTVVLFWDQPDYTTPTYYADQQCTLASYKQILDEIARRVESGSSTNQSHFGGDLI